VSQPRPPRSAIIGAGMVGSVHAHAVHRAGGYLAAVSGSTPHSSQRSAERLGADRAATAEEIFTADDVDVVHICTPNSLHPTQAATALASGKHVICEKPLATTVADAGALVEAAAKAKTVAAVPFIYRFYPMVREARCRIADATVWLMHGGYLQDHMTKADPAGWRSDPKQSGISMTFADIGSHWCDLMEFVTGHRITAVSAMEAAAPRRGVRQDDGAVVNFRTDRGAVGSVVVSRHHRAEKASCHSHSTVVRQRCCSTRNVPMSSSSADYGPTRCCHATGTRLIHAARYSLLPAGHPQGYQDCFNAFVADVYETIRTGAAPEGLPVFADGLRAAMIHAAVAMSVTTGAWTEVANHEPPVVASGPRR
jgi:predicted dehydrogenase